MLRSTLYLVKKAKEAGCHPQVILAGRAINDSMPRYVAGLAIKGLNKVGKKIKDSNVLIMGLTCKEDVADTRESPDENRVEELKEFDVNVFDVNVYWYDTTFLEAGGYHL